MPPRIAAFANEAGLLGAMPAYLPSAGLGCKLVTLFPGNKDRPTHQAAIMLFDPETGTPIALMDGTYVTEARTAGAAALAARLLARDDASVLAILGTGAQARAHAHAFAGVRDWNEIRIAGRDQGRRRSSRPSSARRPPRRSRTPSAAPTSSQRRRTPQSPSSVGWLSPGTHVSSVGATQVGGEVDPAIVAEATLFVETRAALAPPPAGASELAGLADSAVHAELGELVSGARAGRTTVETTLYKSVGVAVQDLAAAALVLAAAQDRGTGLTIELEEIHDEPVQPRPRRRRRLRDGNRGAR